MHFCVSAARVSSPGTAPAHLEMSGFRSPRKIGTNWFMPALVNNRFGESGISELDGTMVCCFDLKKSRNDWRMSADVMLKEAERLAKTRRSRRVEVFASNFCVWPLLSRAGTHFAAFIS